jgi:hypothetical protein
MTDFTPPRVFVAVAPCRVVDTRNVAGPYGGPALATNVVRPFDIDNGPCPGLPLGIEAYSLNFGAILPPADGFLTAWPTGTAQPLVSQLNLVGGEVVANAAIVPAGTGGSINVLVNIGPTHIYIDINGYFSDMLGTQANSLEIRNASSSVPTLLVANGSGSCGGPCGIHAQTVTGNAVSALVTGSGAHYGVYGQVNSSSAGAAALRGLANSTSGATYAVFGENNSSTNGAAGVFGRADGTAGTTYGVLGTTAATTPNAPDAAGVQGKHGTFNVGTNQWAPAGVRGDGQHYGVFGVSGDTAVRGIVISSAGFFQASGSLGRGGATPYGVWADGGYGGSGPKYFVEPHPTDASKVIRYVSLEGPEAGTYFRGRGRFERGLARIAVPEDFRMVSDKEGLTVQVTPIGAMASFAVLKADLQEIVVQSSRSVEFYYLVQGVRATHRDLSPIGPGDEYTPEREDATIPLWLTEGQRRLLIQNGTYNADGTVNRETARRLGWDRVWAEREGEPATEPMPE